MRSGKAGARIHTRFPSRYTSFISRPSPYVATKTLERNSGFLHACVASHISCRPKVVEGRVLFCAVRKPNQRPSLAPSRWVGIINVRKKQQCSKKGPTLNSS